MGGVATHYCPVGSSLPASHWTVGSVPSPELRPPSSPTGSTRLHCPSAPSGLETLGVVMDEYMDMICCRDSVKADGRKSGKKRCGG